MMSFEAPGTEGYTKVETWLLLHREVYKGFVESFFDDIVLITILSSFPLLFLLQRVLAIIFAGITKRHYKPYSFLNILDLIIFILFTLNIVVTLTFNLKGTSENSLPYYDRAWVYLENFIKTDFSEEALWIFCIVILWVRVFYLTRYNEFLGKFMAIFDRLVPHVSLFFVIYIG